MRRLIAKKPKILETKKKILRLVFENSELFDSRSVSVWYSRWPDKYFTVDNIDYKYEVLYYSRNPHIVNRIDIRQFSYISKTNNEIWNNLGAKQTRLLLETILALTSN